MQCSYFEDNWDGRNFVTGFQNEVWLRHATKCLLFQMFDASPPVRSFADRSWQRWDRLWSQRLCHATSKNVSVCLGCSRARPVAISCHCMPLLWSAMDLCSFKRFLGSVLLFSSARFWLGTAKVSPEAPAVACSRSISEFVTSILVTCHVVFAEFLRFTLTPSHAVATGLSTAAQEACCANLVKAKTSDIQWAI